jgi:hypothetical protein
VRGDVLARLILLVGMGLMVAGVWLAYGLPWALIGGGLLLALFGLLAIDVDKREAAGGKPPA